MHLTGSRYSRHFRGRISRVGPRLRMVLAVSLLALAPTEARAAVEGEAQFILNTFAFLIWGALVMWMAAGFTMLEAGSVRTKNASMICLKNIGLYSIAGLAFYLIGYNLMYVGVGSGGLVRDVRPFLRHIN